MRLSIFRRRIDPADLPPVSGASMPGPMHSGLTGDAFTAAAAAGAELLATVVTQAAAKVGPVGPDTRVCAYGDPYTGQLACPACYADDVSVLWTPRTSDDLPDGGLCAFCGVDVLIAPGPVSAPVVATEWPTREPRRIEQPTDGLPPLGVDPPLWRPGRYTVTYSRVGDLGRRGRLPAPMPLTTEAMTAGDLARAIADDVRLLTGLTVSVVVDQAVAGGYLIGSRGRTGTFTFEQRGIAALRSG